MNIKMLAVTLVMFVASFASAQVQAAFTGTFVKNYNYTSSEVLYFSLSPIQLFPTVNFTCPGLKTSGKQYYIEITVYTELNSFFPEDSSSTYAMQVILDSSLPVYPENPIGIDATAVGSAQEVTSMIWTSELLSPGTHNFSVYGFLRDGGQAESTSRKMSATLYLYAGPAN